MSATIIAETGCVYRVGRRRFLTERAAFAHMARMRLASMRECVCDASEYDDLGRCTYRGYTCSIHDARVQVRYARFLRRAWKRGWRPEEKQHAPRDPGLHILQHALGLDDYGQGNAYRNRFVTTPSTVDWPLCQGHVEAGRMERRGPHELLGGEESYCFVVTEAGRRYVKERSPAPPRLSRSQRRYRAFLDADSGMTFGEWLRAGRP